MWQREMLRMSVGRENSKALPAFCAPSFRRDPFSGSLTLPVDSFKGHFLPGPGLGLLRGWGLSLSEQNCTVMAEFPQSLSRSKEARD